MAQLEALPAVTKPRVGRTADPCVMVIFGFTGDLTRRKLIPALYNLASQQLLSREFAVVGVGRSPMSNDDARKKQGASRSTPATTCSPSPGTSAVTGQCPCSHTQACPG